MVMNTHSIEGLTCTVCLPFTSFTHAVPGLLCHHCSLPDSRLFILTLVPEPSQDISRKPVAEGPQLPSTAPVQSQNGHGLSAAAGEGKGP